MMILNLHEFQKMKRITDKNLLVKLYLAKEKHWLRTIIITSVAGTISFISSIVMKIMDSSGVGKTDNTTGLVSNNTDNSLTLICAIISLVLFLVFFIMVLFIQISDVVYAKYSANISKNKDLNFNLDLIEKTNKVCEEKFNTLVGVIDDVKLGKIEPPAIVNKPCNQLRNICNAISETIVDIMIMVYTCRNKFAKAGSEDIAKYNIETVLLRFESRIKIEMCLYYLYYLHENESN